jgi:hypothetical protein
MNYRRIVVALAMSALLSLANVASAQKDARLLGSSASGLTAGVIKPPTSDINLTAAYANASYGTGAAIPQP